MQKKWSISDDFGLRWVKKPRRSETVSDEKCYLYRSTRHISLDDSSTLEVLNRSEGQNVMRNVWPKKCNTNRTVEGWLSYHWQMRVGSKGCTPRADDLYDLYDLYPLDILDISGEDL